MTARKIEELDKERQIYISKIEQMQIEARRLKGLQQPSEQLTMYLECQETSIVKKDALIQQLEQEREAQDNLISTQAGMIDDLKEVINSRKCSGCGKQKQDVDRMYSLCCLCCHPIRPGQSIEEALASCKQR